jgi:hypothetical protein
MKFITCAALILGLSAPALSADWTLFRRISQAAGCAASMADGMTTLAAAKYGAVETNPLLGRDPGAARVIGIKLGLCVGQIAWSEWRLHQYRRSVGEEAARTSEIIGAAAGIGETGLYSAFAFHNLRLENSLKAAGAVAH